MTKKRKHNKLFSEEQEKFIYENAKGRSAKELTQLVNQTFKLSVTVRQIESYKLTHKIKSGLWDARIKSQGEESIYKGRIHVKVKGTKKWRLKHHVIWENEYGKIPDGHVLLFADQNPMNCTLDNLILVSRRQLAVINKQQLLQRDKKLNEVVINIADVMLAAADKRQVKQCGKEKK